MKFWQKMIVVNIMGVALTAQAGGIEALRQFNNDADGIAGTFTQTVQSKKKTQKSSGSFQILLP